MTEHQLIEQCILYDRMAQQMVYEKYSRAMYTSAYRITGDFELAGEVLQDAFLSVFRNVGKFEGRSTLGAWIKKIMVRTAIAALRKKRLLTESFNENHDRQALDWGMEAIDAEYLEKAILQLPDGYRAIFLLAEVEGYTHREIAVLLDISEGTSKSQLWNAKKRLRALLAGQTSFQTTGS